MDDRALEGLGLCRGMTSVAPTLVAVVWIVGAAAGAPPSSVAGAAATGAASSVPGATVSLGDSCLSCPSSWLKSEKMLSQWIGPAEATAEW